MAMSLQTWSLSGLAVELRIDRRTLAKKLRGLAPIEEKRVGWRTERRWLLFDAIAHLNRSKGDVKLAEERVKQAGEIIKRFVAKDMIPSLVDSPLYRAIALRAHDDFGLSKEDAFDLLLAVTVLICRSIGHGFEQPDMDFPIASDSLIGRWCTAKEHGSVAEFVKQNWPLCGA